MKKYQIMVSLWSTVISISAVLDVFFLDFFKKEDYITQVIILLGLFGITMVEWLAWQWWMKKHSPRTVRSQRPISYDTNQRLVLTNKMTKRGWWVFVFVWICVFAGLALGVLYFTHDMSFVWSKLGTIAIGSVLFAFVMWLLGWRIYAKNTYTIEGNMLYIHEYEIHHITDLQIPLADIDSVQFFGNITNMGQVKMVVNGNKIKLNSGFCAQELYTALSQRI